MNFQLADLIGRPNRKLRSRVEDIERYLSQGLTPADIHRVFLAENISVTYNVVLNEVHKIRAKSIPTTLKVPIEKTASDSQSIDQSSPADPLQVFDRAVQSGASNPLFKRLKQ
jgi:hypothetical protein